MNLGQTMLALLALVFFTTLSISINRLRVSAVIQTVDHLSDLEAINFGQSIIETVAKNASTTIGYTNLENRTFVTSNTNSGRTLYAYLSIDESGLALHDVEYKKLTVAVYSDSIMVNSNRRAEFTVAYTNWWNN